MKKYLFLICIILCICQSSLAQHKERFGKLRKIGDTVFIEVNKKLYVANQNVVTVKLKSGISKSKMSLNKIRSN